MMRTFILLLFFSYNLCVAQKNIYFTNDNLEIISKEKYDTKLSDHEYRATYENDSIIIHARIQRIKEGQLTKKQVEEIKSELTKISNKIILDEDIIVINYYPGKDKCNSTGDIYMSRANYKKYNRKISKIKNVKQFFIYNSTNINDTEKYGENINWDPDINKVIEKYFFRLHYPCGSYVIIRNDGTYYSKKGEYVINNIIKQLKK